MPSKTTKSSSVAKPRGKGSQDDSDDEMKEIKAHGEVHVDEPDAPQTNGKKQRVVCLFIYYEQNSLSSSPPPNRAEVCEMVIVCLTFIGLMCHCCTVAGPFSEKISCVLFIIS